MANEEILAFLFAGMLISGTLIILLSPVIFRLTEEVTKWKLYGLLALVLGIMGVSLYAVYLALSEPLFFLPFVALVLGLRASSPTFLFRSLREKFELRKFWTPLRIVLAAGFLGYAGYLVYVLLSDLFADVFGQAPSSAAVLSEALLMAVGGAFVIVRVFAKILPESLREKPTVWVSAILLSLAFAVMAPFAFPNYDIYYRLAGLAGWIIGFVVIWRFS
ncbi:MAG: hypothetical protein ACE5HJ_01110 [Thermoplasmata archaeon]